MTDKICPFIYNKSENTKRDEKINKFFKSLLTIFITGGKHMEFWLIMIVLIAAGGSCSLKGTWWDKKKKENKK